MRAACRISPQNEGIKADDAWYLDQENRILSGAMVIGRFENSFGMTAEKLAYIFSMKSLQGIPIIANVDFGWPYDAYLYVPYWRDMLLKGSCVRKRRIDV